MGATLYGDYARVVLCQTITAGTKTTTTYEDSGTVVFFKCEEPEIGVDFDSKIKNQAYGKSRITPDLKYKQYCTISNGILLSHQASYVKKWLMDRYIAKAAIYLMIALPNATGVPDAYPDGSLATSELVSWYNASQSEVFYLKGYLDKFKVKLTKGRVYKASFTFKECWA